MEVKVVLITGGSSGIGRAIGVYLTQRGMKVYGTARNPEKYPDFHDFELLPLDVTQPETIKKAVASMLSKEKRLDVLINNAGIGITGPVEETPDEEIQKAFDTNFNGPIRVIKTVLPQMRLQKSGVIINVTSIGGHMGLPFRGVYSATKGALAILTESLRMETKNFGVRIVNVAPGDVATNIASRRYHTPASEDSPYYEVYKRNLDTIDADVDAGGDPNTVAEKVYQIIHNRNPKVNYPVGAFMQKLSLKLKRFLPEKIFEKLLLNHYKL